MRPNKAGHVHNRDTLLRMTGLGAQYKDARMTETHARQRYSFVTEKSLSQQTSYSGKKKRKKKDPLGLGRHISKPN